MKAVLAILLAGTVLGLIGHQDQSLESKQALSDLVNQMSVVCHAGNTSDCQTLISQVQAQGYEVLSNAQGYYWAEVK